jgi:putative peptidoglycan lipid II flippase
MKLIKAESYRKGIINSTGLNILAKGISFLNTLIIAYFFGSNTSTDMYFFILSVAALISVVSSIDYLVLVPETMRLREQESEKASQRFVNFFIYLYSFVGIILTIIILISPIHFYSLFSKFDNGVLKNNSALLYTGSIIITFQLLNNLISAILASYKYFTITLLSGLINSAFGIAFTFIFHNKIGIAGTLAGISIGYIINFLLLLFTLRLSENWNFFNVGWMKSKRVLRNIGLMQINILPVWIRNYIVLSAISGMGKGAVTSMNISQNFAVIPEVFILSQLVSVVGIKFSELAAKKDFTRTSSILSNVTTLLFIIFIPISITMAVCNKDIITFVLERGNFNKGASELTSFCFFYFALFLPTKILDTMFTRLFTSFQVYGLSTFVAFSAHMVITIAIYLSITHFQLKGYFISLILSYTLIMPLAYYLVLKLRFKKMDVKALTRNFFLFVMIMVIVFFCSIKLHGFLFFHPLVNIFIISLFSFIFVLAISYFVIDVKFILEYSQLLYKKIKNKS